MSRCSAGDASLSGVALPAHMPCWSSGAPRLQPVSGRGVAGSWGLAMKGTNGPAPPDAGATRRDCGIKKRGVQQPQVGRARRAALVLALPAALLLAGCVASPQHGITNSGSPSQLIPAPESGAPITSAP